MSTDLGTTVDPQSSYDLRFSPVRDALEAMLQSGEELGAGFVVDVAGDIVVDIWGGWADAARTRPWTRDTIVNVWSTTKTVTALAVLMLIDRGQLDPFAPVATYWPEFAAAGKDAVEVRHLMGHSSGVSGWASAASPTELYEAERAAARLAIQNPWWAPGTASGYHALSFGHLLGELVRRVDGRSLTRFIAEEIAGPLSADFRLGAAPTERDRIAEIIPPPPLPFDIEALDHDSAAYKTFTGPLVDARIANTDDWRAAELGAVNGHGNARSVARILSVLSRGGAVEGVRLLSADTINLIFEEQSHGPDLVLGIPLRWGIGYALTETVPYAPQGRACYWGGWGGSMVICDLDRQITIAYVMNRMAPGIIGSDRSEAYVRAVEASLLPSSSE